MSIPFMDRGWDVLRFWTEDDEGSHKLAVVANQKERTFVITFDDYPPLTAFHAAQAITLMRDGFGSRFGDEFAWKFNAPINGWCMRWQNRFDNAQDIDHEVF